MPGVWVWVVACLLFDTLGVTLWSLVLGMLFATGTPVPSSIIDRPTGSMIHLSCPNSTSQQQQHHTLQLRPRPLSLSLALLFVSVFLSLVVVKQEARHACRTNAQGKAPIHCPPSRTDRTNLQPSPSRLIDTCPDQLGCEPPSNAPDHRSTRSPPSCSRANRLRTWRLCSGSDRLLPDPTTTEQRFKWLLRLATSDRLPGHSGCVAQQNRQHKPTPACPCTTQSDPSSIGQDPPLAFAAVL